MTLSVIIVSYNVRHYLEQCLLSLRAAMQGIEGEVIVVDNHSSDDTVERLRWRFNEVTFISNNHNLGFSRANNIAARRAKGKYILFLNPDTIVGEDVLCKAISFMDAHEDAGCLGVRMLTACGVPAKESRRGVPTPMTAFYKMTGLCQRYPANHRLAHYYMSYLPWDKPCAIEIVSGAFCMASRKALDQVGLFDEDFFMYGEDIDLSFRMLKGGWHNYYLPLNILHYKGESTQKSSFRYVHVFYEAMLIFFRKHYGHLAVVLSLPIRAAIYFKAALAMLSLTAHKLRKELGSAALHKRVGESIYLLIGSREMIGHCQAIADEHGFTTVCREGTEESLPQGHLSMMDVMKAHDKAEVYAVYDTSVYSRKHILELFHGHPNERIRIATYHKETDKIITEQEIYARQ